MDNQSTHIQSLFLKYSVGTASQKEVQELLTLLAEGTYDEVVTSQMRAEMTALESQRNLDMDRWENVLTKIKLQTSLEKKQTMSLWPRILAVASAVAVIFLSVYFFNYVKTDRDSLVNHNISPGKVGATLTLASGKKIKLTAVANGEIAEESGVSVTKTAEGQLSYQIKGNASGADKINTLSTEKGETFILSLPDKSKVWLNAASSLTYAASLNERGKRVVRLIGEAYFEVAKDKEHPFIVESRGQKVEVLGTHFNINSYPDEPSVKTTLLEGVVRIAPSSASGTTAVPGAGNVILKPNEQAVLENRTISVRSVVADDAIAWKNGYFMFDSDNLENVMTRIARWYNIQPFYEDESLKHEVFLGTISKYERISEVLHMLERTGGVSFKIDGKKVIVSRNK